MHFVMLLLQWRRENELRINHSNGRGGGFRFPPLLLFVVSGERMVFKSFLQFNASCVVALITVWTLVCLFLFWHQHIFSGTHFIYYFHNSL